MSAFRNLHVGCNRLKNINEIYELNIMPNIPPSNPVIIKITAA